MTVSPMRQFLAIFITKRHYKTVAAWFCVFLVALAIAVLVEKKSYAPIFIEADGLNAHELQELQAAVGKLGEQQFYQADLSHIADTFLKISWVDKVLVSRDWQKGIVATVRPKTAVANFGSEQLLDVSGAVFVSADKTELQKNRTRLYGEVEQAEDIMQKTHKVNQWFTPLGLTVEDVILTPRHTWLIRFDTGLRITVDYERTDEKLYVLSELLKQGRMPVAIKDIAVIDLRYKDGFSLTKKTVAQTQ